MIAPHQADLPVQAFQIAFSAYAFLPGEVAKVSNRVVGLDAAVPVRDERFVHRFAVRVWPLRQPDDVLMPEMRIGGEVCSHG